MHGGAIKMMDGGKVSFSGNQFLFNTAKVISPPNFMSKKLIQYGIGAALNLDCNNEIQGLSRNCDVNIELERVKASGSWSLFDPQIAAETEATLLVN